MKKHILVVAAGLFSIGRIVCGFPIVGNRAINQKFDSNSHILDPGNLWDGVGVGIDTYKSYSGDGSIAAGWPSMDKWVSFVDMFNANKHTMLTSCPLLPGTEGVPPTTDTELGQIWNAIQSAAYGTNVDHRFILAVILQESKGCVRVRTTSNGVTNPGLMQTHNGAASCNKDGNIQFPCPDWLIFSMVEEGVGGTNDGDGLAGLLNKAVSNGCTDAQTYYTAARTYNSGSYTPWDLNDGRGSTGCYANDITNRLTGWVDAPSSCTQY